MHVTFVNCLLCGIPVESFSLSFPFQRLIPGMDNVDTCLMSEMEAEALAEAHKAVKDNEADEEV